MFITDPKGAQVLKGVLDLMRCELFRITHLVPRVCSISWVDEDGDDLGFGQERCGPLSSHLRIKVVGTLLKVVVGASIGGQREVLHVPDSTQTGVKGGHS